MSCRYCRAAAQARGEKNDSMTADDENPAAAVPTEADVTRALVRGAAGHAPSEVAIALLASHGYWFGRADFVACVRDSDDSGGPGAARGSIDWKKAMGLSAPTRALLILHAAANLAAGQPVQLSWLSGLGFDETRVLLDAFIKMSGHGDRLRIASVSEHD
ncbi:hypothetical protein LO772_01460 [Yinghuangia sp. ASG 101]|uniref:hypothetical protein n=1 Tax=Yinghuangia sp. ASG 101 TaxID=2896848 RepID=UPI001E4D4FEE|nr:hypothetical protein [Yinghuangia sp. ASG 101]UGQ12307.1 hypothetical protein LO772_01460 [Yinghuangia sp. ASG 101]